MTLPSQKRQGQHQFTMTREVKFLILSKFQESISSQEVFDVKLSLILLLPIKHQYFNEIIQVILALT